MGTGTEAAEGGWRDTFESVLGSRERTCFCSAHPAASERRPEARRRGEPGAGREWAGTRPGARRRGRSPPRLPGPPPRLQAGAPPQPPAPQGDEPGRRAPGRPPAPLAVGRAARPAAPEPGGRAQGSSASPRVTPRHPAPPASQSLRPAPRASAQPPFGSALFRDLNFPQQSREAKYPDGARWPFRANTVSSHNNLQRWVLASPPRSKSCRRPSHRSTFMVTARRRL